MSMVMDVAKVTAKGQITIPADVREAVGVREGDKVVFVLMDDGTVSIRSSNLEAVRRAQDAFAGAAEEAGPADEGDLSDLIRQVRRDRAEGK